MSLRPESLFGLFSDLTKLPGVGPKIAAHLSRMNIFKPADLIFHLPKNVIERPRVSTISGLRLPMVVTVEVQIGAHFPPRGKSKRYKVLVDDSSSSFELTFFHPRKDWLRKMLPSGEQRLVSGKVELFDGTAQMTHPDYIVRPADAADIPVREFVYPLTEGVSRKVMHAAVQAAVRKVEPLPEWIEPSLLADRNWPSWADAVKQVHSPKDADDLLQEHPARQRLAYDEFLAHQLTIALARAVRKRQPGRKTQAEGKLREQVAASLPFDLTNAQIRALADVSADMAGKQRMHRLLQGDVGSGKTLVALMALLDAIEAGGQGALMVPTSILAQQHFANLEPLCRAAGVTVEILTGRDTGRKRQNKLEKLAGGEISLLIGTHALFQKDVEFHELKLVIIDEQHRFGVHERMELGSKGVAVDVLVMTATPIPRSLAMTHYGDLDVSVLDEKPPGRKPVDTVVIPDHRRKDVIRRLAAAIAEGRQAYWVCPLVEESERLSLAAAEDRFEELAAALGRDKVGLVHGRMKAQDKDQIMADFVSGKLALLVATTVIEVGVDVPAASIMVIEQAENFGLAQLHQLRGRVGRGSAEATCLLVYSPPLTATARRRLEILRETEDGFLIAEEDLKIRGSGDVIGVEQSGMPTFRIADPATQASLLKIAHDDARLVMETDAKLVSRRGKAILTLLHLLEQNKAIRLLSVG